LSGDWVSRLRVRPPEGIDPPLISLSRISTLRVFVSVPVIEQGRMLGSVVLLAFFSAFTISRPLRAVMLQARRAAGGERGAVIPVRHLGTREIEDLSASI